MGLPPPIAAVLRPIAAGCGALILGLALVAALEGVRADGPAAERGLLGGILAWASGTDRVQLAALQAEAARQEARVDDRAHRLAMREREVARLNGRLAASRALLDAEGATERLLAEATGRLRDAAARGEAQLAALRGPEPRMLALDDMSVMEDALAWAEGVADGLRHASVPDGAALARLDALGAGLANTIDALNLARARRL
jgi:hypothetical protein